MATRRREPAALLLHLLSLLGWCAGGGAQTRYQGREVGALSQLHHGVRGTVFAVDSRTLYIKDLHYDGEGPAAYFYVGKSKAPGAGGVRLRDERGASGPLRRYRGEGVTLALPDGLSLKDVRWFSIWCDEYAVNFGDVRIPRELEYPRPARVAALRGVHGVSSDPVVVVDAQTLLVPHFSYDGEAPDAKFWVGRGEAPSPQGIRIPDENGKEAPLRKYDKKTIVLTLPGELTVFDIGHFGVWCEAFTVDFGHVQLPRAALHNVPPSLKMLGVSPQSRNAALVAATEAPTPPPARRTPPPAPLARLDATTYRPHLRPGTGPLQALLDQPQDHSALHRRADSYSPPQPSHEPQLAEEEEHDERPPPERAPAAQPRADPPPGPQRAPEQPPPNYYVQQQEPAPAQEAQGRPVEPPRPAQEGPVRVEVLPPELLELQYYEPPPDPRLQQYYQQAAAAPRQNYFGVEALQQQRYEQHVRQQLQQQSAPREYRPQPYDRPYYQ